MYIVVNLQIAALGSTDVVDAVVPFNSLGKSWARFLTVNSPYDYSVKRDFESYVGSPTWFTLSDNDTASIQYGLQLVQVNITVCVARGSSSWNNCLLNRELDNK